MKERAYLICAVLSGDIPLLSHSFLIFVTLDVAASCRHFFVVVIFIYADSLVIIQIFYYHRTKIINFFSCHMNMFLMFFSNVKC